MNDYAPTSLPIDDICSPLSSTQCVLDDPPSTCTGSAPSSLTGGNQASLRQIGPTACIALALNRTLKHSVPLRHEAQAVGLSPKREFITPEFASQSPIGAVCSEVSGCYDVSALPVDVNEKMSCAIDVDLLTSRIFQAVFLFYFQLHNSLRLLLSI